MIKVPISTLQRLVSFAAVHRSPSDLDGKRHWVRLNELRYAGDSSLALHSTDGRTTTISHFPVENPSAPWSIVVEKKRLATIVKYLQGGRRSVGVIDGRFLCLDFNSFHIRLPRAQAAHEFIKPEEPTNASLAHPVSPAILLPPLKFVSASQRTKNDDDRAASCSWYAGGLVVGSHRLVEVAAAAPRLPFDIHLRQVDCAVFARWLKLVADEEAVDLVCLPAGDRGRYLCRTADGLHSIWLTGAARSCPRELVDQSRAGSPGFVIAINREVLRRKALLFGASAFQKRLVCELSTNSLEFVVASKSDRLKPSQDRIPVQVHSAVSQQAPYRFEVGAAALVFALGKFADENVRLVYRPDQKRLSVVVGQPVDAPELEAIVRTSGVSNSVVGDDRGFDQPIKLVEHAHASVLPES